MPADATPVVDEVEMPSRRIHAPQIVRHAEADHAALHVAQVDHVLAGDHLAQRPVRRTLALDAAYPHVRETPVDTRQVEQVGRDDPHVERPRQRPEILHRRQLEPLVRPQPLDHGERGRRGGRQRAHATMCIGMVGHPVEDDHLALQRTDRAQAGVAVAQQLRIGDAAFVQPSLAQRGGRRELVDHVGLGVGIGASCAGGRLTRECRPRRQPRQQCTGEQVPRAAGGMAHAFRSRERGHTRSLDGPR